MIQIILNITNKKENLKKLKKNFSKMRIKMTYKKLKKNNSMMIYKMMNKEILKNKKKESMMKRSTRKDSKDNK